MLNIIPATLIELLEEVFAAARPPPSVRRALIPGCRVAGERGAAGRSKRPTRQPALPPALPLAAGTAAAGTSSAFLLPQHWGLAALKENPLLTTCQCYIPPQSNFY